MHSYKYFLIVLVVILFGCSFYSQGSIENEWNSLRWNKDTKLSIKKQGYFFSIPEDGENYIFECINSNQLILSEIKLDGELCDITNQKKYHADWGQIRIKDKNVQVWINPKTNRRWRQLQLKISSFASSTTFSFESES